ncbi:TPA: hypothetical protein HA246_04285 [Candidatus Woesearchaeota archaeon]|nr:hypothetical protein [Candidatus Woesearchaeota archaeon]
MAESTFRGMINFLGQIGIYDVVLPFLLVFTIVFAVLEKTKILGVEKFQGEVYTKKQLNAITAFVIAFLVIASTRLVSLINEALANTVILLILSVMFLLLIGSFYREGEDVFLQGGWRTFFTWMMFVSIILIFLHAVRTKDNQSWLEWFWGFIRGNWKNEWVASLIFVVVVVVFMYFITKTPERGNGKGNGGGNGNGGGGANH